MFSRIETTSTFVPLAAAFTGLIRSLTRTWRVVPALLVFLVGSGSVQAQEQVSGQGLSGWWLFTVFLIVLTAGLYLQSTKRRPG